MKPPLGFHKVHRVVRNLHSIVRNHGIAAAAYGVAIQMVRRCIYVRTLQCVVTRAVDEKYLVLPAHLRFGKLDLQQLLTFAETPEYELSRTFVERAVRKGDECYAILDGDGLASYGWYAGNDTLLENDELSLRFDSQYVYMYKGLTLGRYRGQRLHAIAMTHALAEYKLRGYDGLVSYVESHNFDSLKSCYRMGYEPCGRIYIVRLGGRYFIRRQHRCHVYGLAVDVRKATADTQPVSTSPVATPRRGGRHAESTEAGPNESRSS